MKKKAFKVLNVWMAPPRRAATTPAANLACKHVVIGSADHSGPVNECTHFRGNGRKIRRGAENDAVSLVHGRNAVIDEVLFYGTLAILVLEALHARNATVHLLATEFNKLCFNAFGFKFRENAIDHFCCIAALAGRSVESDYFHEILLIGVVVNPIFQESAF